MLYGLSKTKEMLEHNYQRESSGCNSKCSMRSCATERVINKAGISGSCSCSIGFTVRQQPKTFFFLFTTLPVPSWKDVWSNCSPVYRPSGNDSIRFGRLYLLKQCGGIYYLSDSWKAVLQSAELFFFGYFIYKTSESSWIALT